MLSAIRFVNAGRLLAIVGVVAIGACAGDVTEVQPFGSKDLASGALGSGNPASSDTTRGGSASEWHLATIRGVVLGINGFASDTTTSATTVQAAATVEIHKIGLTPVTSASGDTASMKFQDLGVVATVTTDAAGRFEYVLREPLVVKAGQPSPLTTYHLTITPPASSRFGAESDVQVLFMEQLPASQAAVNYYLFPRKN